MIRLTSPDANAPRSLLADWLELIAVSTGKSVGRSALDSIVRFTAEERSLRIARNPISEEAEDGEIVESPLEALIQSVLAEIEWRIKILGPSYPFRLEQGGTGFGSPWQLHGPISLGPDHTTVYVACLLVTAFRRDLIDPDNRKDFTHHRIGYIFQICACLGIGGYVGGDVVSFGWPRATGNAFLPALKDVWVKFGAYTTIDFVPDGAPSKLKDGGIDVIAWRKFEDNRPSCLLIFGQAASGDDWQEKSAQPFGQTLVDTWFSGQRPRFWLPATVMPFVAHEHISTDDRTALEKTVSGQMSYHETAHGLIFDRFRVVLGAVRVFEMNPEKQAAVDGANRINELVDWVDATLNVSAVSAESAA